MIFVLEVPDQADPSAWFAFDLDDLLRKIETRAPGLLADSNTRAAEGTSRCRIFWSEAEAVSSFERASDPLWQGPGWRARLALREQLIATEVLADDL
jgi:hypothetical protein